VIAYSAIEFAMHSNGIIEPSPHLLVVRGNLDDHASLTAALRVELARIVATEQVTRVGVGAFDPGSGDGAGTVIVALQRSFIATSPIPRSVRSGGRVRFDLELVAGYGDPTIHFTGPTGEVGAARVHTEGGRYSAELECGAANGEMQIEIDGTGANGILALAKFPISCGTEPPRALTVDSRLNDVPSNTDEAEQRMFTLVNREREQAGRSRLVWDEEMARIARAHSSEMRRAGIVSETLPTTGKLKEQVRAARPDVISFANVGRAYGLAEAHQGLFDLPSARAPLLSASVTRIGIGIVFGRVTAGSLREVFITELIVGLPP
jgi:uncharacterized protein YkwD